MLGCASFQSTFEDSKIFSSHHNLQNLFSSNGFVKISASCSSVFTWSMKIMPCNTWSQRKWWQIWMCFVFECWVVRNFGSTLIVVVEWHILHIDAIVLEGLLHPYQLSVRSSINVLSFCSGEWYTVLLLRGLAYQGSSEEMTCAWRWLVVHPITSIVRVWISNEIKNRALGVP